MKTFVVITLCALVSIGAYFMDEKVPEEVYVYDEWYSHIHGREKYQTTITIVGNTMTIRIEPTGWYHYIINKSSETKNGKTYTLTNVSGADSYITISKWEATWITQWNEEFKLTKVRK